MQRNWGSPPAVGAPGEGAGCASPEQWAAVKYDTQSFGEVAEWLNAAVLKTVEGSSPSGGSNPSLSATHKKGPDGAFFMGGGEGGLRYEPLFDKRGRTAALTHEVRPQGEGQDAPSLSLPQFNNGPQGRLLATNCPIPVAL